eukprot:gene26908-35604_t
MSCPCGLLKNEVLDLDQRDRVILREGRCQNLLANGGEGVCGQPLGSILPPVTPQNLIYFWEAVNDPEGIVKTGNLWTLANGARWIGNLARMVIRDCYVTLADKVLDGVTKISLVLGIKGIGKTVFINYLLVRIVEKYRALNEALPDIVYVWKPDDIKRVRFSADGVFGLPSSIPAPFYLSDSVDIADASLGTTLLLEVTSHDADNYRKFSDRMVDESASAFEYYIPAWNFDELLIVNPISDTFSKDDATFLFDVFGGCARYFAPSGQQPEEMDDYIQKSAEWFFGPQIQLDNTFIWCWTMKAIRTRINKMTSGGSLASPDKVAISSLFRDPHISVPGTNFFIVGYTSRFMRFLAGCLKDDAEATLWNALKDIFGPCGEGVAFESLGHKTLVATEQEYVATNLKPRVRANKTFTKSFYQMPRVLIRAVGDIEFLLDDQYGLPLFGNFALVDAVIQPNLLLQFTIGKTHGKVSDEGKYAELRSKLRGAKGTHKLIFVLKPENLEEFQPVGIPEDLACFKMAYMMLPSKKMKTKR